MGELLPNVEELLEEARVFPDAHDDIIDVPSQALNRSRSPHADADRLAGDDLFDDADDPYFYLGDY